ncbi:MAG TPA: M23 family metallopeptidase [Gemmatimonadaceae bacterium]|nr:M23 family metallopeptidase [Gemmatimonadaceae bacterium]
MPTPRSSRLAIALFSCAAAACTGPPGRLADSTTAVAVSSIPIQAAAVIPAAVGVDSLAPLLARVRASRGDTATYIATDLELAELRRALVIPVAGVLASDLRDTYTEARSGGRVHDAIDILAPRGTPVVAAADGRLDKLHHSVPGGLMVYEGDASDRFVLMYGHLDRYADGLVEGAMLRRGQVIGYVGTTGNANVDTPHLHFAIARGRPSAAWWRGTAVNPFELLGGHPAR